MNFLYHIHSLLFIVLFVLVCVINTKYLIYFAWIPLFISFTWILFNGCILNIYDGSHNKIANDRTTPFIAFISPTFAKYLKKNIFYGLKPLYINIFFHISIITIIFYRYAFNCKLNT